MVLAIDQGAHACHALFLEARDQARRTVGCRRRAGVASDRSGWRNTQARCRLAEFPGADFARDIKPISAPLSLSATRKMPLRRQHFLPVVGLVGAGQPRVQAPKSLVDSVSLDGTESRPYLLIECACSGGKVNRYFSTELLE